MISVLIFILFAAVLPYISGCMLKCLIKDRSIGLAGTYVTGFTGLWILFAVVQLPLKLAGAKLQVMAAGYLLIVIILFVLGVLLLDRKHLKHLLGVNIRFEKQDMGTYIFAAIMIAGVIAQIAVAMVVQADVVYDNDYFAARAMQIYTDGFYDKAVNPFTGNDWNMIPFGMLMSCSAEFIAVTAYIFQITPLTAANIYMPLLIIPVIYMSYYILSFILFKFKKHRYMFLSAAALLSVFSNYSLKPKESVWNLMFINSWNPDVAASSIFAVLVLYYTITAIRAEIKYQDAKLELDSETSDAACKNVVKAGNIFRCRRIYLTAVLAALCFTSEYGVIMGALLCFVISGCYYFANYGKDGMQIKNYLLPFVPFVAYIAVCIIYNALKHNIGSLDGFWHNYAVYMTTMFVNNFKANLYLAAVIIAITYIAFKKNDSGKIPFVYTILAVFVVGIINPLTYVILGLIAPQYCNVTYLMLPLNAAAAYAMVDVVCALHRDGSKWENLCIYAMMAVIILCFMPSYGSNFAWQRTRNSDRIPDETKQICDIINSDGQDKNVIAVNELCSTLRLYDQDIKLYYYTDNTYAAEDDKEMYIYLNQEEPYIQGIVQNAKRNGYNYVIFRKGLLDPNWASVQYHIWPAGSTDNYDVYSIGYF